MKRAVFRVMACGKPGSCDHYNASFADTVTRVNASNIPYVTWPRDFKVFGESTNSNAFVSTALDRAGLDSKAFYRALSSQMSTNSFLPGWGVTLPLKK